MLDCMRRADRGFWKLMKHYEPQAGALLKLDKAGRRQRLREIKVETEKSLFSLPLSASATNGLTFDVTAQISSFLELTDSWVVKVKLIGACSSCSISMMTLKNGVEMAVKRAVPEVKEVIEVSSL